MYQSSMYTSKIDIIAKVEICQLPSNSMCVCVSERESTYCPGRPVNRFELIALKYASVITIEAKTGKRELRMY